MGQKRWTDNRRKEDQQVDNARFGIPVIISLIPQSVKDKLDTFKVGSTSYPAIFSGKVIPATYQDLNKTLLIFRWSSVGVSEYAVTYQISCRSSTESDAEDIAQAVYTALNRVHSGNHYLQCNMHSSIQEDTNSWLVPIDARVMTRT